MDDEEVLFPLLARACDGLHFFHFQIASDIAAEVEEDVNGRADAAPLQNFAS
jgi:hypothetical protein